VINKAAILENDLKQQEFGPQKLTLLK